MEKGGRISIKALQLTNFSAITTISLQYQNRKVEYFKAIWEVLNWKAAEKRFAA